MKWWQGTPPSRPCLLCAGQMEQAGPFPGNRRIKTPAAKEATFHRALPKIKPYGWTGQAATGELWQTHGKKHQMLCEENISSHPETPPKPQTHAQYIRCTPLPDHHQSECCCAAGWLGCQEKMLMEAEDPAARWLSPGSWLQSPAAVI